MLILLRREGYRSITLVIPIISLLALSLILAIPTHTALGATPASPASRAPVSVVPTLLDGYEPVGPLAPSTPVTVTIGIPLQNEQSLEYLSQQISTPGSPMYHQFLSQAQIQTFLPTAEFQGAVAYLKQRGLTIVTSSLDSIITAQGTASQVSHSMGLDLEL